MSRRKTIFANDQYYHVFNKSVAGEVIFEKSRDLGRAIDLIDYYHFQPDISFSHFQKLNTKLKKYKADSIRSSTPLVEILSFALMPNHFHFLLKQLEEDGISKFTSLFQNSFARFFNTKYERSGKLFLEMFKAKRISEGNTLYHISRYIHLNPVTSYLVEIENLKDDSRTSFSSYCGSNKYSFIATDFIMASFKNSGAYKKFVFDQSDYQKVLSGIRYQIIEKTP